MIGLQKTCLAKTFGIFDLKVTLLIVTPLEHVKNLSFGVFITRIYTKKSRPS